MDSAPLKEENSEVVARVSFEQIFVPNDLPRLVIVYYSSVFKGLLNMIFKSSK